MKPKIACILIGLCLFSCHPRQKNVWMVETQNAHSLEEKNINRVYLDKFGALYPNKELYIPYKAFFDPKNKGNTTKRQVLSGNLDYYFTGRFKAKGGGFGHYKYYDFEKRSDALKSFYQLPDNLTVDQVFEKSQEVILQQTTDSLNVRLARSVSKTLVVFIHGFNDPNPSADYRMMKSKIAEITQLNDLVYLEVFWDGLTANQGSPPKSKIWGYAQFNSSQVAVTIREILTQVNHSTKIRVITHSLGASVGTGALFNTTSKWKDMSVMGKYNTMTSTLPAPKQTDIRLGMLAPAIPGVNTFKDFDQRGDKNVTPAENNIKKVVVGHNCNDYAVTKRVLGSDYLSARFGSTTLGANLKKEVSLTKGTLSQMGFTGVMSDIAFNSCKCQKDEEEHGVFYYMQRKDQFKQFIEALFL